MGESTAVTSDDPIAPSAGKLPRRVRLPKIVQGAAVYIARHQFIRWLTRTHGDAFTLHVPLFGHVVVITEPMLARAVFSAPPAALGIMQPNMSRLLGGGSVIGLDGEEHRRRRKLLAGPFHGKSLKAYEEIVESETRNEIARWPEDRQFAVLPSMTRITLNVILRTVFGAADRRLDELRDITQQSLTLASRLAGLPKPPKAVRRFTPWGRLQRLWIRYTAVVNRLISEAEADPYLDERTDVLAQLVRGTYDDGSTMSRKDIRDELLTLLVGGTETTASTLAWAFEQLTRDAPLLADLRSEALGTDSDLRQAALLEVQRYRTVLDFAGRHVHASQFELGEWLLPRGTTIFVSITQLHSDPKVYANPNRFMPRRFIDSKPPAFAWCTYGGGTRRCVGAAFASMEMDVVLRTVLRDFVLEANSSPAETRHHTGAVYVPKHGGRISGRRDISRIQ